jgi:hypothetical protein
MSFPRDGEIYSENSAADYLYYKVIGGTVRTYKNLSTVDARSESSIWLATPSD